MEKLRETVQPSEPSGADLAAAWASLEADEDARILELLAVRQFPETLAYQRRRRQDPLIRSYLADLRAAGVGLENARALVRGDPAVTEKLRIPTFDGYLRRYLDGCASALKRIRATEPTDPPDASTEADPTHDNQARIRAANDAVTGTTSRH